MALSIEIPAATTDSVVAVQNTFIEIHSELPRGSQLRCHSAPTLEDAESKQSLLGESLQFKSDEQEQEQVSTDASVDEEASDMERSCSSLSPPRWCDISDDEEDSSTHEPSDVCTTASAANEEMFLGDKAVADLATELFLGEMFLGDKGVADLATELFLGEMFLGDKAVADLATELVLGDSSPHEPSDVCTNASAANEDALPDGAKSGSQIAAEADVGQEMSFWLEARSVAEEVAAAVRQFQLCLGAQTYCEDLQDGSSACTVTAIISWEHVQFAERLATVAKQALLTSGSQDRGVCVMGYKARPFTRTQQGFVATLFSWPASGRVCRYLCERGFCRMGDRCHHEHPTSMVSFNFMMAVAGPQFFAEPSQQHLQQQQQQPAQEQPVRERRPPQFEDADLLLVGRGGHTFEQGPGTLETVLEHLLTDIPDKKRKS